MTVATMIVLGIGLLVVGVPVSISFGIGAMAAILLTMDLPPTVIAIQMFSSLNSFLLIAIPLFTLTGFLMDSSKTADTIYNFASSVVGFMKGGLGHVNVVSSVIFGGISGSGSADVLGLGKIEITQMSRHGYPLTYSVALTAASSTIAPLIPPSIIMVIFASVANVSVAEALFAGLVPGVTAAISMMIVNRYCAGRNNWGSSEPFRIGNIVRKGGHAFPALLAPVVLLGGILTGWFTPTEAAVVATAYIILISVFFYSSLSLRTFLGTVLETSRQSGQIMLILVMATLVAFVLTVEHIPELISSAMFSLSDNKIILLLLINLTIFVIGMFLNGTSAIIILVPLFQPILERLGVDMVHFGAILCTNLAIGLLTPPFSPDLYASAAVGKVPPLSVIRPLMPFYIALIANLLLITFVPELSLWLPGVLFD